MCTNCAFFYYSTFLLKNQEGSVHCAHLPDRYIKNQTNRTFFLCRILMQGNENAGNILTIFPDGAILEMKIEKKAGNDMKAQKMQREMDMLHGGIVGNLLMLALPLAMTGILQQLFNAADVAVVGSYVGKHAMGAVGSNSPIVNLLVNFFVGISLGANILISQHIGKGSLTIIRKAVHTSVIIALGGGLLMAVAGQFAAAPVISALGVPDTEYDMAVLYLRIYLAGLPVILLYNFGSALFRSMGDTRTPLLALAGSGIVNVALNLFFVRGLHMSVEGVAIATVVSNTLSSGILFLLLCKSKQTVRIEPRKLRVDGESLREILRLGLPAGIQGMVFSLANICVQSAINSLGTDILAASSAAYNLEAFTYCIINSFGQACTTMVGQNCGAGKIGRCRKALGISLLSGGLSFGTVAVLILLFSHPLLMLFMKKEDSAAVMDYSLIRLHYIFFAHIFSLFVEVLSGYLRGFGMSAVPAVCSLVFICGTRIVWVYEVFPKLHSFAGLMTVYPVSLGITALVIAAACFLFRKQPVAVRT